MRKTDLTPEVQKRICNALRVGNTRRASAIYGGVSEPTFYRWMQEGEAATRGAKREFREAVIRAEAECEVWHVANLKEQAGGDWRASVEWLKRRRPSDWGETHRQDITSKGEKLDTINIIVEYTDEPDGDGHTDQTPPPA